MTAAARLVLRLNPTHKDRIVRAADLRSVSLSAFVRDAVLREAESVMAAERTVKLSPIARALEGGVKALHLVLAWVTHREHDLAP